MKKNKFNPGIRITIFFVFFAILFFSLGLWQIERGQSKNQILIEFEKKPSDIKLFMKEIDDTLKKLNSDYEAKRTDNLILKFPEVIVLQNKEFYTWLKQNKRLGGQNKIPRLNESRIIAEEIITIKNKFSTNQNTNNN